MTFEAKAMTHIAKVAFAFPISGADRMLLISRGQSGLVTCLSRAWLNSVRMCEAASLHPSDTLPKKEV
jgi:hypothetical protein